MTTLATRINALLARMGIAAKVIAGPGHVLVLAKSAMDLPVRSARRADDRSYPYRARVTA